MKKLTPIFIALLIFSACKKDSTTPASTPVKFTATTYDSLGTYDDNGKPSYLTTSDVISSDLTTFLNAQLPETKNLATTNPTLLSSTAKGDITMTQKSDVYITYVATGQATSYRDAIAFYTYDTNNPPTTATDIKKITYIFPNAGNGTTLHPGDKVKIGTFDIGTSVGFVLLQNAWNPTTKTINTDAVHFCSNDALNPETSASLKKHVVLINYTAENKVLIGFEDVDRTNYSCDNDFNDVVVYATVTPAS